MNYSFMQKTKVISGTDSIIHIGELLSDADYKKAFLVFEPISKEFGIIEKAVSSLDKYNIQHVEYDKVLPNPPEYIIDEGSEICKKENCDCIVAIGGGSSIDTAKGINILMFNEGPILRFAQPGTMMNACRGLISIPTTSGTGSELSNGLIVTDSKSNIKVALPSNSEFAIIDPALSITMPPILTMVTGLDVFSHAFEAYTSVLSNDLADIICEKILSDIVEYLPQAIQDGNNLEARHAMSMNAALGGWMLTNACAHVGHSLAHVIGAKYHIPHGAACAYAVPATMEFIASACPGKIKKIGKILGAEFTGVETSEQIGALTTQAYEQFRDNIIGLKPISEYHCDLNILDSCAEEVTKETFAPLCPEKVTKENALQLLKKIFQ